MRSICVLIFAAICANIHGHQLPFYTEWTSEKANIQHTLTGFYSLFHVACESWLMHFTSEATFVHPLYRDGISVAEFCQNLPRLPKALLRQDGPAIMMIGNDTAHVLVPAVFAAEIKKGTGDKRAEMMVHTQHHAVELHRMDERWLIHRVVEFLAKDTVFSGFEWPHD